VANNFCGRKTPHGLFTFGSSLIIFGLFPFLGSFWGAPGQHTSPGTIMSRPTWVLWRVAPCLMVKNICRGAYIRCTTLKYLYSAIKTLTLWARPRTVSTRFFGKIVLYVLSGLKNTLGSPKTIKSKKPCWWGGCFGL
jgi:hypothetical protein